MEEDLSLLAAVRRIDIEGIKRRLAANPAAIKERDEFGNNAMHVCVLGRASLRAPHLMRFLLAETSVDLLHRNYEGLDPLELAIAREDIEGAEMIEPYAHQQLDAQSLDEPHAPTGP
jgi:hypothetical protein